MITRPVLPNDLGAIGELDLSYSTNYVWQMEQKSAGEEVSTTFRPIRLPRSVKVEVKRDNEWLEKWNDTDLFIVAEEDRDIAGYLDLEIDRNQNVGVIKHLAALRRMRRQGYGTALVQEAKRWARIRRIKALVAETETKNYPAISFLQKCGFSFCGFKDSYYPDRDITVFFLCTLS